MFGKFAWVLLLGAGTAASAWSQDAAAPAVMVAKHVGQPIKMDGRMGDPAWDGATAYPLELANGAYDKMLPALRKSLGSGLREKGWVKLLWTADFLYVGARFEDSDIVAEGKEDQTHLYGCGDVVEVFLKPSGETYYWEFYGSPNQLKTCFFYPGRGRCGLPSCFAGKPTIAVAPSLDGTLNDWCDKDKSWTVELAIPTRTLTQFGASFDNAAGWTVLVARYNYSRYLPLKENSTAPRISGLGMGNHNYEEYASLRFAE